MGSCFICCSGGASPFLPLLLQWSLQEKPFKNQQGPPANSSEASAAPEGLLIPFETVPEAPRALGLKLEPRLWLEPGATQSQSVLNTRGFEG